MWKGIMANDILCVLTDTVQDACTASAQLSDARAVRLLLAPICANWRALDGGITQVVATGLDAHPAGSDMALADFALTMCTAQDGYATDLVDLHLDILADTSGPVARLVLEGVPGSWASKARKNSLNALARVVRGQLLALRDTPQILSAQMLGLIEQLVDLDNSAASPALLGLLRILAGQTPSRGQIIAMQIAGLVDSPAPKAPSAIFTVTEAGRNILQSSGLGGWGEGGAPLELRGPSAMLPPEPQPPVAQAVQPFAKLRVMERDFLIADASCGQRMLYRQPSTPEWRWLSHTSADGWTAVAAEIIQSDLDIVTEYVGMHLIRRRDLPTEEVAEAFELMGKIIWLRLDETGVEMRLDGQPWQRLDVSAAIPLKERAIAAVLALQTQGHISADMAASDWAKRMAHAAQITPYMTIAAQ
jgi:hypothetical protein